MRATNFLSISINLYVRYLTETTFPVPNIKLNVVFVYFHIYLVCFRYFFNIIFFTCLFCRTFVVEIKKSVQYQTVVDLSINRTKNPATFQLVFPISYTSKFCYYIISCFEEQRHLLNKIFIEHM